MSPYISVILAVAFTLVAAVVTIILLRFAYQALRWLARESKRAAPLFGSTSEERFAGFVVAALLFYSTLGETATRGLSFLGGIAVAVPSYLQQVWGYSSICHSNVWADVGPCVPQLGFGVLRSFQGVLNAADSSELRLVPFGMLVAFVAVWAITGRLVTYLRPAPTGTRKGALSSQNRALLATLGVGSYLLVAAIVAFPIMEPGSATEATEAAAFERRVSERVPKDDVFNVLFPEKLLQDTTPGLPSRAPELAPDARTHDAAKDAPSANPVAPPGPVALSKGAAGSPPPVDAPAALRDKDAGAPAAAGSSEPSPPPNASRDVEPSDGDDDGIAGFFQSTVEAKLRERRDSFQSRWSGLRDWTRGQQQEASRTTLHHFRIMDANLKTVRQKLRYGEDLESWYDARLGELRDNLNRCRADIERGARNDEATVAVLREAQKRHRLGTSVPFAADESSVGCYQLYLQPAPEPPPGGDLGPFRRVAQWLIETDSSALALITGLLGCGLVGSVVATFVRKRTRNREEDEESTPYALMSVLIRSISAAFVVFLAAKGGLAIVSGGGSQPNPYVLLLACLLAAVFSERVWAWAEQTLPTLIGADKHAVGAQGALPKPPGKAGHKAAHEAAGEDEPPPSS